MTEEECSYHLCENDTSQACRFCQSGFCDEHADPKKPGSPPEDDTSLEARKRREKNRQHKGHPCPRYYDYLQIKKKEEKRTYRNSLNKLLSLPAGYFGEQQKEDTEPTVIKKLSPEPWYYNPKLLTTTILLLIALIGAVILYHNAPKLQSQIQPYLAENKNTSTAPLKSYVDNVEKYDGEQIEFTAYLQHAIKGRNKLHQYFVRMNNETIRLSGLNSSEEEIIPYNGTTQLQYHINGTMHDTYRGLTLRVNHIREASVNSDNRSLIQSYLSKMWSWINTSTESVEEYGEDFVSSCPSGEKKIQGECKKVPQCKDGTLSGECGVHEPYYCKNGTLVKRASKCGCPFAYVAKDNECVSKRKVEAKEAFSLVNKLRKKHDKKTIAWDSRAHKLSVSRSKDMFKRGYFDHVTPEGTCVKDMKSEYNFSQFEILAENIGGMTHRSDGTPIASTTPKEAVRSWMESRGHRYNLMYTHHKSGAIGCYKYICTFLGVHKKAQGFGSGPCTTGEEGKRYWRNAPPQPGEV